MPHPDLSIPLLPDAEHDLPLPHPHPHQPQYTWPEAGPSSPRGTSAVSSVSSAGFLGNVDAEYAYTSRYPQSEIGDGRGRVRERQGSGQEQRRRADGGDTDLSKAGIFGAKAIAAMTGAMATSLLMTPFDVLKTRLQTVPPHLLPSFAPASGPIPASAPIAINSPSAAAAAAAAADCCQTTYSGSGTSIKPQHPLVCTHSSSIAIPFTKPPGGMDLSALRPSPSPPANANANPNVNGLRPPSGCLNPSKWAGIWGEPIPPIPSGIPGGEGGVLVLREGPGVALRGSSNIGVGDLLSSMKSSTSGAVSGGIGIGSSTSTGGFWKEVAAVRAESGIRGLWKGVGTAITMGIPSSAIYMLGYEHLSTVISPYFLDSSEPVYTTTTAPTSTSSLTEPESFGDSIEFESLSTLSSSSATTTATRTLTASLTPAPLIAGSLARTLSATVISPIEMFRTRLQALPIPGRPSPTYTSVTKDMYRLVQSKGPLILYRGLGPTLWRDVPFSGIYWASFELLKTSLTSPESPLPFSPLSTTLALGPIPISFVSGFVSGTFAALLTQPFDVLKTRRQVFNPTPGCVSDRHGGAGRMGVGTVSLVRHVVKTEGWAALYAGTSARCGKVAPACGLMIACYEGVGRLLGGE
ncbi:metallochaperone [Cryptococcus bacillisporus CA1873]|uniref:Metallochaperone n=1 Tax=Cryptococcus bacillisporus CA1873 TaxID=1296111 RepID=A0ABR5BB60_CRYGA|nr:metallochaperone [Cryptococcus bacillisporus CA1873]|eukprot:KIR62583.1 metallochaperone [Cryptococcus gattii CA1873]